MADEKVQNLFLDAILGKLATRIALMDSISNVQWDAKHECALLLIKPQDPKTFDDIKELLIETLREITSVKFKLSLKRVNYANEKAMVLKIKEQKQ